MGARKLVVTTIVSAPAGDGGEPYRVFGPGDDVPDWAAKQMGDHCFEGNSSSAGEGQGDDGPPPMGGAGSGGPEWVAYARKHDVDVEDDAKREDVIDALRKAGVAVERTAD